MVWFWVWQVVSTLIEWVNLGRRSNGEKDLEILLLRRQLAIYERKQARTAHLSRGEKLILVVLATKLKAATGRTIQAMADVIQIVKPTTLFGWHSQLVRRKWTYHHRRAGRPRINRTLEQLVLHLAGENDWGYERIEGELLKLGYSISHQTIGKILQRNGILPAPERHPSPSWRHLMTHYKELLLACDFFTVETLFLQTIYVLVFIEIGTRRVHFAGCTAHPNGSWVTQQARQLVWEFEEREPAIQFLIHDNDKKFTTAFDTVFHAQGIDVIPTPFRAPNANAFMERWVQSAREECLDKVLIINQAHLRRVMGEYIAFFNAARPHQGLDQQIPLPKRNDETSGPVHCHNILGGILHDYYRDAA